MVSDPQGRNSIRGAAQEQRSCTRGGRPGVSSRNSVGWPWSPTGLSTSHAQELWITVQRCHSSGRWPHPRAREHRRRGVGTAERPTMAPWPCSCTSSVEAPQRWRLPARRRIGESRRDILRVMSRSNLLGLQPAELEDLAVALGASRYRGRQLATWMYRKGVVDLGAMTDLPRDFRARLAETHEVVLPEIERETPSQDGSRKLVFRL